MQAEHIGRYKIVKELGRGAMGRVFLAHDPQIDRHVAIKTIQIFDSLQGKDQDQARERFMREARAAGKLMHPGIVTVFDVGEADGVPYLAMEYVEGATLDEFCHAETLLPVKTVVAIVANAAEALDFAHATGIVHRDIKPANLMRVGETSVKVMDFGLARGAEAQITHDGALLGTPSYMSPEQVRGQKLDGRTDLFSLAACLYEMLTGEKPFGGDSISAIIFRVVNEEPEEAAALHERVPRPLSAFVQRGLAKNPDERFPTGEAFAQALRAAAAEIGSAADTPGGSEAPTVMRPAADVPEVPSPAQRKRKKKARGGFPWVAVLLILILGGGGAAAYVYRDKLMELIEPAPPPEVWYEATVRTEPEGLPVTLDGEPFAEATLRFKAEGPFGLLAAEESCRSVTHQVSAADAGGEIVLVTDPVRAEIAVDPGVKGARIKLNGKDMGRAPLAVELDLCEENELAVSAKGYQPGTLRFAAGMTPLEARNAAAGLQLAGIPKGTLVLPATAQKVKYYVNGEPRTRSGDGISLPAGRHTLRMVNDSLWIDVSQKVTVQEGKTVKPPADLPGIADLVVQAFPANCKVFLRKKGGGEWRYVDDVPLRSQIAAGEYEVKVQLKPTGQEQVREVELFPGQNPPIRVSFGRS